MVVSKKDLEEKQEELKKIEKSKLKKLEYFIDYYLLEDCFSNPIKIKIYPSWLEISESSVKKVLKKYQGIGWEVSHKWDEGKPLYNDFGDYEEYPGWHFNFTYKK